jgi:hypothetical protein
MAGEGLCLRGEKEGCPRWRAIVSVAPSWHRRAGVTLVSDRSSVCEVRSVRN